MSTDSAVAAPDRLTSAARRSIFGGVITLPALALPAALRYVEPATGRVGTLVRHPVEARPT
jgi:hypothetical protein